MVEGWVRGEVKVKREAVVVVPRLVVAVVMCLNLDQ